jgi:hypothetical protein
MGVGGVETFIGARAPGYESLAASFSCDREDAGAADENVRLLGGSRVIQSGRSFIVAPAEALMLVWLDLYALVQATQRTAKVPVLPDWLRNLADNRHVFQRLQSVHRASDHASNAHRSAG